MAYASFMTELDLPEIDSEGLHALLDRLSEGVLWVDPKGQVLWANQPALEMIGRPAEACIGHHASELPLGAPLARTLLDQATRGQTASATAEIGDQGSGTRRRQLTVEAHPVFRGGRLSHVFWILRDVTQATRAAAEPGSRVKDDFLAVLSHELRSPLAAILMWIRVLQQGELAETTRRGLGIMERGARALERIIEDLLHISRISAGKFTLSTQETDLRSVLATALEHAEGDARLKGIEVHREGFEEPACVEGDPGRLQQAIGNLLSNAVKFTPSAGRIDVSIGVDRGFVRVRVADTGRGMRASFLPYAFDRFRQQDSSSTRSDHGLGIGLYIVRHVVELHGGTVTAASPGLDQGSVFTILLPQRPAPSEPGPRASGEADAPPASSLEGLFVLLVDDEPDTREALRMVLEQSGLEVETAGSAREAMTRFAARVPDLLLSDIAMPGEDGLSLIQKVRELPPERGGKVPAAAITAYAGAEDRRQVLAAGFQHHVAKPVDPARLLGIISTMVRARRR